MFLPRNLGKMCIQRKKLFSKNGQSCKHYLITAQKVILALGDYMNVQAHVCIGGTNVGEDIRKLDFGQHVVVGTPGRTFDMIRRRNLRTRNIKLLILDEADEMLNRGFKEQIYDVYRYLPPATQVHFKKCWIKLFALSLESLN